MFARSCLPPSFPPNSLFSLFYKNMYVHRYLPMGIRVDAHMCVMHVFVSASHCTTYMHTNMHKYILTCIHACMHASIHTYIHASIHTYKLTYTHARAQVPANRYTSGFRRPSILIAGSSSDVCVDRGPLRFNREACRDCRVCPELENRSVKRHWGRHPAFTAAAGQRNRHFWHRDAFGHVPEPARTGVCL